MATKTITIDLEAYNRLKAVQHADESFSSTIKRVVRAPLDLKAYARNLRRSPMSAEAIGAVEEHLARRHEPSTRRR
ncbi:MAG: antitoxin VapB family protein [Planctomycetaceae bacterium]|nr:antitoxin VapB family protein [Planctomycetaceae bacterium]